MPSSAFRSFHMAFRKREQLGVRGAGGKGECGPGGPIGGCAAGVWWVAYRSIVPYLSEAAEVERDQHSSTLAHVTLGSG